MELRVMLLMGDKVDLMWCGWCWTMLGSCMFGCSKCRKWWIIFMGIVISFRDGREGRMMV